MAAAASGGVPPRRPNPRRASACRTRAGALLRAGLRLLLLLCACAGAVRAQGDASAASEPPLQEQSIIFCSYGPHETHELVALEYARLSHPHARIFLAVHNYTDDSMYGHEPAKWKYYAPTVQILAALNVTRLFVQPDETPRHAQLMRGYRHGSDSPVVYERFCLARFITIAHVVELYNLESVLFVDADVVLFNNAYELLGGDHSWGFGSWTSFWLRHDAIAFADFVAAFYTGDPRHDAYTLKRYGSSVLEERSGAFWKKLEAEHRGWWPKELAGFDADGRPSGPRYYITDMEVYKHFLMQAGLRDSLLDRMDWAPSLPYACHRFKTRRGDRAVTCPFISNALQSKSTPGGCYSGNATVTHYLGKFDWQPRGLLPHAPRKDDSDVFTLHYNRMCKYLLCLPYMVDGLPVMSRYADVFAAAAASQACPNAAHLPDLPGAPPAPEWTLPRVG